jgi:hypothetical protein
MEISDVDDGAAGSATGTKPGFDDNDAVGIDFFDATIQFLSKLAFRPLARATAAIDTPVWLHASIMLALNSALCRRHVRRCFPTIVSMCPRILIVDTMFIF